LPERECGQEQRDNKQKTSHMFIPP
jgi:hypothetical protein